MVWYGVMFTGVFFRWNGDWIERMEVGDNRIELVVGIFAFERIRIIYVMSGYVSS